MILFYPTDSILSSTDYMVFSRHYHNATKCKYVLEYDPYNPMFIYHDINVLIHHKEIAKALIRGERYYTTNSNTISELDRKFSLYE